MVDLELEFKRAIIEHVEKTSLQELQELCKTADKWYDGRTSKMRKFAQRYAILDTGEEYALLVDEAHAAYEDAGVCHPQRPLLLSLAYFARCVHYADQRLRKISSTAIQLSKAGVSAHRIMDIVSRSLDT